MESILLKAIFVILAVLVGCSLIILVGYSLIIGIIVMIEYLTKQTTNYEIIESKTPQPIQNKIYNALGKDEWIK